MATTAWDVILIIVALIVILFVFRLIETILRSQLIPRITDKYVLVTGCDSGFGNLVTRQLDKRGVHVFAACLTEKGRKELESKTSERVYTLPLDVTSHESIVSAFKLIKSKLPENKGLWGLVNNAGIAITPGPIAWSIKDDYERTLQVNLLGVIDVTITFLPLLKKARGRVVNIASALSRVALSTGGYAESKFGVVAFSDSLRRESQSLDYGIKVSILEPGYFKTPISTPEKIQQGIKSSWNRLSPQQKSEFDPHLQEELTNVYINFVNFVSSPNLTIVTNAMIHALLSRWPKTRYACGLDMKLIFVPMSYVPTWFCDFVFRHLSDNTPVTVGP